MKIISVVGPTAVGKTSFTLKAAEEILKNKNYSAIDLISADSRQVYRGLEVISGADVPPEFQLTSNRKLTHPFYSKNKISLHGVSIISPDEEWSVAHFQDLAWEVLELAQQQNHLVIVIGGTGLYHDQLLNLDSSLRVKPNKKVRQKAGQMELKDLQAWAKEVSPARFAEMNYSDKHNPRRLIRVIEIGLKKISADTNSNPSHQLEQVYVGLNQDLAKIEEKIKKRVLARFSGQAIPEVKQLQAKYQDWSLPAFSALGVSEVGQYLNGLFTQDECLEMWTLHELQYARRQLTWWRNRDVVWFGIDNHKWKADAFAYILNLC